MPYRHFSTEERYVIAHMHIAEFSLREIGRRIGRHHVSISREIARNRPTYGDDAVYWYDAAEYFEKKDDIRQDTEGNSTSDSLPMLPQISRSIGPLKP